MNNPLILGIDCGGTKTIALLATLDEKVVGRGFAGSGNSNLVGKANVMAAVDQAVEEAFYQAGESRRKVAALCVGMAGVDRPAEKKWFTDALRQANLAEKVSISNDALLLLAAGTPEGWGLGAISGTGSIVFGATPEGKMGRAGGWGYVFGDEGSGYDLGRQALRAVARAADGRGEPTMLVELVLSYWNLNDPSELIPYVYQKPTLPADIAELSRLVVRAMEDGDGEAKKILSNAAEELALSLQAVAEKLSFKGRVPCALGGGVFVNTPELREQVHHLLEKRDLTLSPVHLVEEPVIGAVRLAARLGRS